MPADPTGAVDVHVTLAEIAFGGERLVTVPALGPCVNCEGAGREGGERCVYCDGTGEMVVDRPVTMRLEPGLANGDTVAVPGPGGGVIAIVREAPHPTLTRDGDDLRTVLDVEPDVLEGGDLLDVDTLDGETELRVPPGTADGTVLRITGAGMPAADGRRGDLLVEVRAVEAAPPEVVREARRRGRGPLVGGVFMLLIGAVFIATGIAVRATTDICVPDETARCVVVIDGVARGYVDESPGEQESRADFALLVAVVVGAVFIGFGTRSTLKGLKVMGEHRAEAGQSRPE